MTQENTNTQENDIVRVVRYIRPPHEHYFPFDKYEEHSNLYGVTVFFELDHINRTVTAFWAVCNGDNFSRKGAIEAINTQNPPVGVIFPMSDVSDYKGLVNALIHNLAAEVYGDISVLRTASYRGIHNLFLKASRELKARYNLIFLEQGEE